MPNTTPPKCKIPLQSPGLWSLQPLKSPTRFYEDPKFFTDDGHRVMTCPSPLRGGKPRPLVRSGGSGSLGVLPLLGRSALQLIEDQLAMLLEYAQRPFERMEHRLSN